MTEWPGNSPQGPDPEFRVRNEVFTLVVPTYMLFVCKLLATFIIFRCLQIFLTNPESTRSIYGSGQCPWVLQRYCSLQYFPIKGSYCFLLKSVLQFKVTVCSIWSPDALTCSTAPEWGAMMEIRTKDNRNKTQSNDNNSCDPAHTLYCGNVHELCDLSHICLCVGITQKGHYSE